MIKRMIVVLILSLVLISCVSANDLNDTDVSDFDDLTNQISQIDENQTLDLQKDYQLTNTGHKHIVIDKSMTIDGNNHTIDAPDMPRVFWVKADNVCIKNINFINSKANGLAGGVISWWGNNGSIYNCNFTNNSAVSGGGAVYWSGENGIISNCNFINNSVVTGDDLSLTCGEGYNPQDIHIMTVDSDGGALVLKGNNMQINRCNFEDNCCEFAGGAISAIWADDLRILNSKFKNNNANQTGGAINLNSDNAEIFNSTFANNSPIDLFNNCPNTEIFMSDLTVYSMYGFKDTAFFDDLERLIRNTLPGGVLVLNKDYQYINGSNKGILINKSITIDGAGHTLNGNHLSRMFNITADNVTLRNINFENGNAFGRYFSNSAGGGAIYWNGANGIAENCNFTNNTGWGIEDDPFDKEETIVNEDGSVIYIHRFRPMGAKINEGGAIVWNGTNGTVSKCVFKSNNVGYPNTGGAICWRGSNGKVQESKFLNNDAWCGSAIAWIGANGEISSSVFAHMSMFDGGIFWFGKNGTIINSILLGLGNRSVLRPSDCDVKADFNFWGDMIESPNSMEKIGSISNWMVMNITHNGELIKKGQTITINYKITDLMDKNGNMINFTGFIDELNGEMNYTAQKTGYLKISLVDGRIFVKIDSRDKIAGKNLIGYYTSKTSYSVKVTDISGNVAGKTVKFTINGKKYYCKTDKNGVATLKLNLKPGKYTVYSSYGDAEVKNTISVKKTVITKNLYKKVKKSAKFKVKVLTSKGKPYPKKVVKIKFKGKTYKIKTNKKGIAVFKVSGKLKVGKYNIKTSCNGLSVSNKIVVRK